ncbi:MAG: Sel1 domain-containing [Geobacteraceae bacterium]|nr:MAG: Sel1 domain-containing [Geobacteraceae bacterium]
MRRRKAGFFLWACVCSATLVTACTTVTPGVKAYKGGAYATALQEFKADNSARSHYNLGLMYYKGEGVREDKKEAFTWFCKAAEQGYAPARFSVGVMYYKGVGVERDREEAAKWLRKAADQGEAKAQFNLGLMYNNGEGVDKDRGEAVNWFRKAAKQGHGNAQEILKSWGEEW